VAVPERFVGCWVRDGVSVGDEDLAEPADVVWLQGREWFADLRVPRPEGPAGPAGPATTAMGARPEAFAGRCQWVAPDGVDPDAGGQLRWLHDLDWSGGFADGDGAEARWVSARCFEEHGTVDEADPPTPFREVWRAEPDEGAVLAAVGLDDGGRPQMVSVSVHGRRLVMVDRRASGGMFAWSHARRDESDGWHVVHREVALLDDEGLSGRSVPGSTEALAGAEATADWLGAHPNPEVGTSFAGSGVTWVIVEAGGEVHHGVALSKPYRNTPSLRSAP